MAHVIVVGNEKGGSGKSTTAMHLVVALKKLEQDVAVIDLDLRQRSLTRYLENRVAWAQRSGLRPSFPQGAFVSEDDAAADPDGAVARALDSLSDHGFIIVDAPGSDSPPSRAAHRRADTVVTPLNDSFVDFDVLGRVDPETYAVSGVSHYSAMMFDAKKARGRAGGEIDWVVVRNRTSVLNAKNKRRVNEALESLSRRAGFRLVPGLSDRVIFRELFPKGLTLMDEPAGSFLDMSRVAARQEVRELVDALDLPGVSAADL